MEVFQEYAHYYNAFYGDKDYRSEAETVDRLLVKFGNGGGVNRLINFGCGTGRHDHELSKLGYYCFGIDQSPVMIDIAKSAFPEGRFEVADIRYFEPQETYDAVISLFHVISYQSGNADVLNTFHSARRALNAGGLFIFDVWYGPGVLSDWPCVRKKEVETKDYRLIKIASPVMHDKTNMVDVTNHILAIHKESRQVQEFSELHRMRYFFRPELELLLDLAGFELLDNRDGRTLAETDYRSWTSYFAARAK